ncbi:MAG: UDP-N-acetylmuramoylalanyl-D-glutamate--2,6-diaminopimelate ligase, partial [Evtepia sp.]|nr:UDP-N-acetylmuramoylalanyl-D-glutamate--2,6-diaminopimelate ligase [Evtepia sp.]
MNLSQLCKGVTLLEDHIGQDIEITSLSCDTRTMQPGALFVALPGYHWDGSDFIKEAVEKGAAAVLCGSHPGFSGPWLLVEDAR